MTRTETYVARDSSLEDEQSAFMGAAPFSPIEIGRILKDRHSELIGEALDRYGTHARNHIDRLRTLEQLPVSCRTIKQLGLFAQRAMNGCDVVVEVYGKTSLSGVGVAFLSPEYPTGPGARYCGADIVAVSIEGRLVVDFRSMMARAYSPSGTYRAMGRYEYDVCGVEEGSVLMQYPPSEFNDALPEYEGSYTRLRRDWRPCDGKSPLTCTPPRPSGSRYKKKLTAGLALSVRGRANSAASELYGPEAFRACGVREKRLLWRERNGLEPLDME